MKQVLQAGQLLEVRWNRMRGARGRVAVFLVCCYPLQGGGFVMRRENFLVRREVEIRCKM